MLLQHVGGAARTLRHTWLCRRASAAAEYALLAPAIILVTIGIFETMLLVSVGSLIDAGTREASRFGVTGVEVPGMSREDRIRQIIEEKSGGLVNAGDLVVSITTYASFEELVNAGSPDPGVPGAGGSEAVVVYDVTYPQSLITPYLGYITGISSVTQHARVVVQNEPF